MNWYYSLNSRQLGPVDESELDRLVQAGAITPATLVWSSGMPAWLPHGQARPQAAAQPVAAGPGDDALRVRCSECGLVYPADDVAMIDGHRVCANCQPMFVQRPREGSNLNEMVRVPVAGFGIRLGAALLDFLILLPVWSVLMAGVMYFYWEGIMEAVRNVVPGQQPRLPVAFQLVLYGALHGVGLLYSALCVSRFGGTPGKLICNLRVVRADGVTRLTFGRAAARYLAKFISRWLFYIGHILILFDEQKRALHDFLCDTRVVYHQK